MQHQNQSFLSDQINMKDPQSAESKEISNFRFFQFLFFDLVIFVTSSSQFSMKFRDNAINKNRRILKIIFPKIKNAQKIFLNAEKKYRGWKQSKISH